MSFRRPLKSVSCTSCCPRSRRSRTQVANGQVLPLKATTPNVLEAARCLSAQIQEALRLVETLEAVEGGWPSELRVKCRLPSFASERAALEALFSDLDLAHRGARGLSEAAGGVSRRRDCIRAKTREAIARGAESGKPFALIALGAAEAKEHIKLIRISGLAACARRRLGAREALCRAA